MTRPSIQGEGYQIWSIYKPNDDNQSEFVPVEIDMISVDMGKKPEKKCFVKWG